MFLKDFGKTALVYGKQKISYSDLLSNVKKYSKLFDKDQSNNILIYSENRPEWIYAFYAAWNNKCVPVPVDFMAVAAEVEYIIKDCKPEVIFCSKNKYVELEKAMQNIEEKPSIIIFDDIEIDSEKIENSKIEICSDKEETAVIIYTSGTTGSPKGVMLSYENLLVNIDAVTNEIPIFKPEDNVLILLPLHHIFPLMGTMICPLSIGNTLAICPTMASEDILKTLKDNKISILIGVPRLFTIIRKGIVDKINKSKIAKLIYLIAKKWDSQSVSKFLFKTVHKKFGGHIKYMVCGGAAIDVEVARDYKILGFEMLEGFGMTEAAPMISFTRPGKLKLGSAGQLMSCNEVKIKDGEILAKGNNIMKGYYNRPQETADVLKDGWLYTGDLGFVDEDNYLHITGRKKEIIVTSNGKNINPVELEFKLESLSDCIQEVGVFLRKGVLHAAIYPNIKKVREADIKDIESYFKNDVIAEFNQNVAPYKKILSLHILNEELPKTRLGKIQRFKLENIDVSKKQETTDLQVDFKEYAIIKNFIENQKEVNVKPNDHLEIDLALDSLDKISLQSFLNTSFGVDISTEQFLTLTSVLKLAEYVKEKKSKISIEVINWAEILKERVSLNIPNENLAKGFTREVLKFSKYIFNVFIGLRSKGSANIPDKPCIIVPNHQSFLDGFLIASLLKRKIFKNTFFYAKAKHAQSKWAKFWAKRNNVILVDINQDVRASVQKMAEALRRNKNIIIFPEGTRTKTGKIGDFKKTFAILSKELNVPIVPVSIRGAYDMFPPGTFFPKLFKRVQINFLPAVYPEGRSYDKIKNQVYNKIKGNL